jgi:integrase
MAEVGAGKTPVARIAEKTTFENLCDLVRDDYKLNKRKSARRLEISVRRLGEFLSGYHAIDITTDVIKRYINKRDDEDIAPATIRNELNVLRRGFNLATEAGKVVDVPHFPKFEINNTRTGFFEEKEFRRVLANLPAPLQSLAEFGYLTGWRFGEILEMRWGQVDFDAGIIRLEVGTTKNNDGRVLPFHAIPALATLMSKQLAYTRQVETAKSRIVPFVFHRNGRQIARIETSWENACRAAGCEGRLFHDLRRTAVRNFERAGVPRSVGRDEDHRAPNRGCVSALRDRQRGGRGGRAVALGGVDGPSRSGSNR